MTFIHQKLAQENWQKLSLAEQLANIGSEISRVIYWKENGDKENEQKAAWRALELIDLTISDSRWRERLKELFRLREVFCDFFVETHNYEVSPESLNNYFLFFALMVRNKKF